MKFNNEKQLLVTLTIEDLNSLIRNAVREELGSRPVKPTETKKDLLTMDELCSEFGFSKSSVYWQTHRKSIPYIKINNRNCFSRSKIEEWIKNNSIDSL